MGLFISSYLHFMYTADVWALVWSAQNVMRRHVLSHIFLPFVVLKEVMSVTAALCLSLFPTDLAAVVKSGLRGGHGGGDQSTGLRMLR
jgi:hypothetical protein